MQGSNVSICFTCCLLCQEVVSGWNTNILQQLTSPVYSSSSYHDWSVSLCYKKRNISGFELCSTSFESLFSYPAFFIIFPLLPFKFFVLSLGSVERFESSVVLATRCVCVCVLEQQWVSLVWQPVCCSDSGRRWLTVWRTHSYRSVVSANFSCTVLQVWACQLHSAQWWWCTTLWIPV